MPGGGSPGPRRRETFNLSEESRAQLVCELDAAVGSDAANLLNAIGLENELVLRRNYLQSCLTEATNEVPTKLSSAVKNAEESALKINTLKEKSEALKKKVGAFLSKTEPLRTELTNRFAALDRLEDILAYLKSFEKIEEISGQLKQCTDDEQSVLLYQELKEMCSEHTQGHRATYVAENAHYWHTVLKEKLSKQYEDVLKAMKWPLASGAEPYTPPREVVTKFNNITKYLLLIQEPQAAELDDCDQSLPVKILLRPLKKRFAFHFTGSRQTARIDRPEWFLTQTLTWIKDHGSFIRSNVQPVAEKLQIKGVRAEEEFNTGLVSLAAERLHTVLGLYNTQGAVGDALDVDAAFAHAIDEALGFHRELSAVMKKDINSVLSVLTKAETFVRWLRVEKKYALLKMDEILGNEQWMEPVAAGVDSAVGAILWVPRGADWFITLLKTIEDRYTMLPQPGHRLQFLELQLELIEEWRVRLTQLMSAAYEALAADSFLSADATPHPLTAVINSGHHTRTALLQWTHSLHYLQLHYYRRQFQHFTELQHGMDETTAPEPLEKLQKSSPGTRIEYILVEGDKKHENDMDNNLSLIEVEVRANKMAMSEVSRRDSVPLADISKIIPVSPLLCVDPPEPPPVPSEETEDPGVFGELPSLLAHLRDGGLTALSDHMVLEFKAGSREYKKQKWHAIPVMEEMAFSVSPSLCRPLAGVCARLHSAQAKLAPSLYAKLRTRVAADLDIYLFEEVVLESWWNTGGTMQFTHDVQRNLMPVFAPNGKPTLQILPRLCEACNILNMDYDDARRLRSALSKSSADVQEDILLDVGIRHIMPQDVLKILNQRTDLNDRKTSAKTQSLMEYF